MAVYKVLYENSNLPLSLLNVELKYTFQKDLYKRIMKEIFHVIAIDNIGTINSEKQPVYTFWYNEYKSKAAFERGESPTNTYPMMGTSSTKSIYNITFEDFLGRIHTNFSTEHRDLLKFIIEVLTKVDGLDPDLEALLFKQLITITTLPKMLQADTKNNKFMEVFGLDSTPKLVDWESEYVYTILGYTPDGKIYFHMADTEEVVTGEEHPEYERNSYFTTTEVLGGMSYMDMEDLIVIPHHKGFFINKYQLLKI